MAAINVKERMRRVLLLSGVYRVIDIYEGLPQQSKLLLKRKHSPNPMETVPGWLCRRSVGVFCKKMAVTDHDGRNRKRGRAHAEK